MNKKQEAVASLQVRTMRGSPRIAAKVPPVASSSKRIHLDSPREYYILNIIY